MQLHIVSHQVGGFAREDAAVTKIVGGFTDPVIAEKVRVITGMASVQTIEVDVIPAGILATAIAMNMPFETK